MKQVTIAEFLKKEADLDFIKMMVDKNKAKLVIDYKNNNWEATFHDGSVLKG